MRRTRAIAGHGGVDEARLAFEDLPPGRVDAALRRIGVDLDLVVLVALPLDPALALLDLRGEPGHVEMVEGFQAPLGVDAGAHGLGRSDQDSDLAPIDRIEQPLLRGGFLVVLHEGDLACRDAARDEAVANPAIGRETARLLGGHGAEVGEDHLRGAGQSISDAVRAGKTVVCGADPDLVNLVDQGVELVLRLVLMGPADEAEVDRGVTAVGDDREQDVVALLRLPLPRLDRLDALREIALIGEEGLARRRPP